MMLAKENPQKMHSKAFHKFQDFWNLTAILSCYDDENFIKKFPKHNWAGELEQ